MTERTSLCALVAHYRAILDALATSAATAAQTPDQAEAQPSDVPLDVLEQRMIALVDLKVTLEVEGKRKYAWVVATLTLDHRWLEVVAGPDFSAAQAGTDTIDYMAGSPSA